MNELSKDRFFIELNTIKSTFLVNNEITGEKQTEIAAIVKECFTQLHKDMDHIEKQLDDKKTTPLTRQISDLILNIKHLKSMKEFLNGKISTTSYLIPLCKEGTVCLEAIERQIHKSLDKMIQQTENWEKNFTSRIESIVQASLRANFDQLIELASDLGRRDLIPILEKRCEFMMSKYTPYYVLRDQLVKKGYHKENQHVYNFILKQAKEDNVLGELIFEKIEKLRALGFSLADIDPFISSLEQPNIPIIISWKEDDDDEGTVVKPPDKKHLIREVLLYVDRLVKIDEHVEKKEDVKKVIKKKLKQLTSRLNTTTLVVLLPILRQINSKEKASDHSVALFEELLFSNFKEQPEIRQYLKEKTGSDDSYFSLNGEPWNMSDWPEKFCLKYQQYDATLNVIVERFSDSYNIIDTLPTTVKESLHRFFAALEKPGDLSKEREATVLRLLTKCNTDDELKALVNILEENSAYVDFLGILPEKLLKLFILNMTRMTPSNLEQLRFIAKLEFSFQAYFIPLLFLSKTHYTQAAKFYEKDPELLKKIIDLETGARTEIFEWIDSKHASETIDYLHDHPFMRRVCLQTRQTNFGDDIISRGKYLGSLLKQGKSEWVEKICILFENDANLFNDVLEYLGSKPKIDPIFSTFFDQDISVIKKHAKDLYTLAKELFKPVFDFYSTEKAPNVHVKEAAEKIAAYADKIEGNLLKKLIESISEKQPENVTHFFNDIESIEIPEIKSKLLALTNEGQLELVSLCVQHLSTENIGSLSAGELLEGIIQTYPSEVQNAIDPILQAWSGEEGKRSCADLKQNEISFLCKLLNVADEDEEKFHVLASCSSEFPLPAGEKLLSLKDMELNMLLKFKGFIHKYPQFGWWTLEYVSKSSLSAYNFLARFNEDEVIACCKSRDPLKALDQLTKSYEGIRSLSSYRVDKSSVLSELWKTQKQDNLTKIERAMETIEDAEKPYFLQLAILTTQHPNSPLVAGLLAVYPVKYESLTALALEGYVKEADALFERTQKEKPLSPWTEKLLQTADATHGRWLVAALELDPSAGQLIEHICEAKKVTDLEINMTYLAAAKQEQLLEAIFLALQDDKPSSKTLIEWVSKGNFTFAEWICRQDAENKDPLYQKLRTLPSENLQESFLVLYRSLSITPQAQKNCLEWIFHSEDNEKHLAKILYIQAHDPERFTQTVRGGDFELLKKQLAEFQPLSSINTSTNAAANDTNLSKVQKALKQQFQFAAATADALLNLDGSINKTLIAELKKSDFFLENQTKKTTVYHYLEWVFDVLEHNGEFSERLAKNAVVPAPGSPAYALIQKTLGKNKHDKVSLRDVQTAILSCLLQRSWQSPGVGSCFGTSVALQSQSTETNLLQTLDDYLSLAKSNSLTRAGKQYPLSIRLQPESVEHPFAKAREYCISSMASAGEGQMLRVNNIKALFEEHTGIFSVFMSRIARKNPESYTAIQSLLDKLKADFLKGSLELYDSFVKQDKGTGGDEAQGGWVLGDRATYEIIDTQEKYEQFLLHLIDNLEKNPEFSRVQEAIALMKQKILNHEFSNAVKNEIQGFLPWANRTGGHSNIAKNTYFDHAPSSNLIESQGKSYRDDLILVHTYGQLLSADAAKQKPEERWVLEFPGHAYSLIGSKLMDMQKFKTFDELESHLKKNSSSFGKIPIDDKLGMAWVDAICSTAQPSTRQNLRTYLSQHPIKPGPLREYGWQLMDALMRVTPVQDKILYAILVEKTVLNLEELKKDRPPCVMIGDYNWFSSQQDACYATYAVSPFTDQIEPYRIGEEGRDFFPISPNKQRCQVELGGKVPEQPWKPFK